MPSIRGDETAKEMNRKARRLKVRERTYAKNKAAVLAYLQDGNFNNFVRYVRKTRDDKIQGDPILVELWHEACVMKKVRVLLYISIVIRVSRRALPSRLGGVRELGSALLDTRLT